MRHGKKSNSLGRTREHRKALLKNLSNALIKHKRINTTVAKAKALRRYVEPLITKAKINTTHSRRVVFSYLQNKDSIKELFSTVSTAIGTRPGGYIRIIKTGFRKNDGAEMAMIELVDFNSDYVQERESETPRRRTRRGRRGASTPAVSSAKSEEE